MLCLKTLECKFKLTWILKQLHIDPVKKLVYHIVYLPKMSIVVLRVHVYNLVNPNYLDLHGLIYG